MRRPAVLFSLAALTGAAGLAEFSSSAGSGTNAGATTAAGDQVDPHPSGARPATCPTTSSSWTSPTRAVRSA